MDIRQLAHSDTLPFQIVHTLLTKYVTFQNWPAQYPLCIHAEQAAHTCSLPAILFLVSVARRPVHICHVSKRVELELVITAKQAGNFNFDL